MSTTTLKTARRAVFASLLLAAVAACSNVAPAPQVASAAFPSAQQVTEGGD